MGTFFSKKALNVPSALDNSLINSYTEFNLYSRLLPTLYIMGENMRTVKACNLQIGAVTAETVTTKSGQVIVPSGKELTTKEINHIMWYGIEEILVLSYEEAAKLNDVNNTNIISYQERVKNSVEFKHFKEAFTEKIDLLEVYMNDVIINHSKINGDDLLTETMDLFHQASNSADIIEMLYRLRKVDDSTYSHSVNVSILCRLLGQWLNMTSEDIDALTLAGLLHDIGKCEIPHSIIGKPGKLTLAEYNVIKQHSQGGYTMLKGQNLDPRIKRAALMHHERCDGSGYPMGLIADDIDSFAIIVSIADVYDAMTTNRCYRGAICPFTVIEAFEKEGFNKYNPKYVRTFLEHVADTYTNQYVSLSNGIKGQIVLKNREHLSRPTIYLENRTFLDLSKHPEISIQDIV